jgi:hypothetical protein
MHPELFEYLKILVIVARTEINVKFDPRIFLYHSIVQAQTRLTDRSTNPIVDARVSICM